MKPLLWLVTALVLIAILALGFLFNESRKEVYYLCGNFTADTSLASIQRQLDTANLSSTLNEVAGHNRSLVFTSEWSGRIFQCRIELNPDNSVERVAYYPQ